MPVFNEEGLIADVVGEWLEELRRLQLDFEFRVYDDGSRDRSSAILGSLAEREPRLVLTRHSNRGHGPTILRGYRESRGAWIFQTDADGEMSCEGLADLWAEREGYDFLLGERRGRRATPARWLVTRLSRLSVRVFFGKGVHDVNSPYRLMRRSSLHELLSDLPDDLFAPNVILSGLAVRTGLRIYETPVATRVRRQVRASLSGSRILRPAVRSFLQTASVALRVGRSSRR